MYDDLRPRKANFLVTALVKGFYVILSGVLFL